MRIICVLGICASMLLSGCGKAEKKETASPAAPEASAPTASLGEGTISGKVTFKGTPRGRRKLSMGADPVCASLHTEAALDEKMIVGEGADGIYPLANVFVYVKSGAGAGYAVPSEPVVVDQVGCKYVPHVVGVRVGQEIQFKNSDKTMHNVHSLSAKTGKPFNRGMPAGSPNASYMLTKPEVMAKMKCDAHPWMSCYIGAMDHPFFAVTGTAGMFSLEGLPDGEYEVAAWHELSMLKSDVVKVTVAGGEGSASFVFIKPGS